MASCSPHYDMVLKCKKCEALLAAKDDLIIGTVPPSQSHLAVRPGREEKVYNNVRKIENLEANVKKTAMCPFKLLCSNCDSPVGSVGLIEGRPVCCFKVEGIFFWCGYGHERIQGKKLKQIIPKLKCVGICEFNLHRTQELLNTELLVRRRQQLPLVYCDTSQLTNNDIGQLTHDAPRDYQRELFLSAMRSNALVYLPTGSGKTLVAAMAVRCMKTINPNKLAVFVVDRIPLVYQQSEYMKKQLPKLNVRLLAGDMGQDPGNVSLMKATLEKLARKQVDVLVLTHQILLNHLADTDGLLRMSDMCILVIDEAHHCSGNHPYNKIMKDFYGPTADKYKPLVLALTASPAGDCSFEKTWSRLIDLLSRLYASACMPVNSGDLELFANRPVSEYRVIPLTPSQQELQQEVEKVLSVIGPILECQAGCKGTLCCFSPELPNYRGALRDIIGRCHEKGDIKGHALGELVTHLVGVLELNSILGMDHAVECLQECLQLIENASTPMEKEKKLMIWYEYWFNLFRKAVSQIRSPLRVRPFQCKEDKFQHLVSELEFFSAQTQDDGTSRGIIFVKMRKTAHKICELLQAIPSISKSLNPSSFVGHGGGSDGMEWHGEQEEILKKFRSGCIKLLVSTSVLEEGLDVPVCNLIIRFDSPMSLRSLVQSRGRASRRPDSRFIVLCSDSKEQQEAINLKQKEGNMDQAMRLLYSTTLHRVNQAIHFACDMRKLSLRPEEDEVETVKDLSRIDDQDMKTLPDLCPKTSVPSLKVAVHNLASSTEKNDVISFFVDNFDVKSMEPVESKRDNWSVGGNLARMILEPNQRTLQFELDATQDEGAHSDAYFADVVLNKWCSRANSGNGSISQAWMERSNGKRKRIIPVDVLAAESFSVGYFRHRTDFCSHWPEPNGTLLRNIRLLFEHDLKTLMIFFTVAELDGIRLYEIEVRYGELEHFILVDRKRQFANVFLSLKHPPRLYSTNEGRDWEELVLNEENPDEEDLEELEVDSQDEIDIDFGVRSDNDEVNDDVDEEGDSQDEIEIDHKEESDQKPELEYSHPLLKALDSMTGWSRVSQVADSQDSFGQCHVYMLNVPNSDITSWELAFGSLSRWGKRAFYASVAVVHIPLHQRSSVYLPASLSDDVKYAVHCLVTTHPSVLGRVTKRFGTLLELTTKPPNAVLAALEKLSKIFDHDVFCEPEPTLESLLSLPNLRCSHISGQLVPEHCALVKRLIITPTSLIFRSAEVMQKNRVLRNYHSLNFLCVNIRDEDFSRISSSSSNLVPVLSHVKSIMDEGIHVCNQHFLFLGCSNSQLRSHSCWFVRSTCNPDEIRRWMGDFTEIKCVASYVSRMGQCFSTSMDTIGITVDEGVVWSEKEDIKSEDHGYTFSDGIGGISGELAREVVKKIAKNFIPSAFQIRFAGCKGVLAIDTRLPGKQAFFRQSMHKFDSSHRRLEVLQTSRPQAVFLNHQVIMLLSNLGVPDDVFMTLMRNELDNLAGTLLDERLAFQQMASAAKTGIAYRDLSDAGLPLTVEPFFRSVVATVYRDRLYGLLTKARIRLPLGEARLMMGVMDETEVLQYGQVFVQYSAASTDPNSQDEFKKSDKKVLTGPVVVTRNPCLHPGDIRLLIAVDRPQLRHLVDCVVFPQLGSRPHPSEMAGGDLDGDLYFVCWHKPLLPSPDKPLHEPMDYKAPPKELKDDAITPQDMTTFIMKYIRSDQLGVIDNAHKAQADMKEQGVESEVCLDLAEAHSLAVDAPKTGRWPVMKARLSPKQFPDFMMKTDKPSYHSQKLLGKLYRACRAFKRTAEESLPKDVSRSSVDRTFIVPGYDKYLDGARDLYAEYSEHLDRTMGIYGIVSEAELVSGCFRKLYKRLSKERTEVADVVSKILNGLRVKFRKMFFEEFGLDASRHKKQYLETNAIHQKASAWYFVAYRGGAAVDEQQRTTQFLSFPWIVDDVMTSIRSSCHSNSFHRNVSLLSSRSLGPTSRELPRQHSSPSNMWPKANDISQSLMTRLKDDSDMLLLEYKRRASGMQQIGMKLKGSQADLKLALFGSTATFLFREDSDVDVCVFRLNGHVKKPSPSSLKKLNKKEQVALLKKLKPLLGKLFQEIRLVDRARVPVICCNKFKGDPPRGSVTTPFDLSASWDGLVKAILVSSYIKSYPGLLPLLRLLLLWGHVSGLTGHGARLAVNTNALVFTLLSFCVSQGYVRELNREIIDGACARIANRQPNYEFTDWESIICNLVGAPGSDACTQTTPVTLNGVLLGEVLIKFFASHNTLNNMKIPKGLALFVGKESVRELVELRLLGLLDEHMQRAYHCLAIHGDLQSLLTLSACELRQAIHLSTGLSCVMRGAERENAREMERKTGAKVTIRHKVPSSTFRLIVEARGTEFQVEAVEQLLQDLTSTSGTRKANMMSMCFVKGASQMLFEGSRSDKDPVKLEPYKSHHHPQHDGIRLYTPMLATPVISFHSIRPDTSRHEFQSFNQKFLTQFEVAERDYDSSVHGDMEFVVHFGRIYIFSVPKSFIEDAECVTIEMLQANLKRGYKAHTVSHVNHPVGQPRHCLESDVRPNSKRKRKKPKKTAENDEKKKKKKLKDKPSRSSFFTHVTSKEKVQNFLQQQGFIEVKGFEEYAVNMKIEEDVLIKFDALLNFQELSFSSLRWCLSDIKRRWKENSTVTSGNFDGDESDVRFILQSRRSLCTSDIRETEYEKYQDALQPASADISSVRSPQMKRTSKASKRCEQEKAFSVKEDVWGDVNLIRHKKTRKFRYLTRDKISFKSRLVVNLSDVKEHSRPMPTEPSCFRKNFTRFEVSLCANLPPNWTDVASVSSFLKDVWQFSFDLSSFLSSE